MYGFRKMFDASFSYISNKELETMVIGYRIEKERINPNTENFKFKLDLIIRKYDDVILNLSDMDIYHRTIEMYLKLDLYRIEKIVMLDDGCLVKFKKSKKPTSISEYYYITRGIVIPDIEDIEKYIKILDKTTDIKNWKKL